MEKLLCEAVLFTSPELTHLKLRPLLIFRVFSSVFFPGKDFDAVKRIWEIVWAIKLDLDSLHDAQLNQSCAKVH